MALKGPMATLRGNREGKQQKVEENDEENEEESEWHFRGIWEELRKSRRSGDGVETEWRR